MIPIIVKDFHWSQNPDWVFIVVDIKGVKTGNTDIVTSPKFLKVHSSPFIFEIFFSEEVDDTLGECTIDERLEQVSFRLRKVESGLVWDQLEDKKLTKEDKNRIRAEALEITQERHKQEQKDKHKRRFDRKQVTVHDQIRIDGEARERVTSEKTLESLKALSDVKDGSFSGGSGDDGSIPKLTSSFMKIDEFPVYHTFMEPERVGIRPTTCISVAFTPRVFPTPSRESTHDEEEEWLKKQTEARKSCGFVDEDLRPEERNPEWLLDKGLSLMRTESYLGAISAFSLGIRLAPKMPELYVERAAAHLAIKNYNRTVADCAQALELLTPKVKANAEDRLKCHIHRGTAFRELEMWEEALADYKEAILLKPENNEELTSVQNEIQMALRKQRREEEENKDKVKRRSGEACKTTGKTTPAASSSNATVHNASSSSDEEDYD